MHDHLVVLGRRARIDPVVQRGLRDELHRVRLLLSHRGRFRGGIPGRGVERAGPEVRLVGDADEVRDQSHLARVPLHSTQRPILDSLESSINPTKSPTFRSGKTGEWKQYFTNEHKKVFKAIAGDLLVQLGYEKNYDW